MSMFNTMSENNIIDITSFNTLYNIDFTNIEVPDFNLYDIDFPILPPTYIEPPTYMEPSTYMEPPTYTELHSYMGPPTQMEPTLITPLTIKKVQELTPIKIEKDTEFEDTITYDQKKDMYTYIKNMHELSKDVIIIGSKILHINTGKIRSVFKYTNELLDLSIREFNNYCKINKLSKEDINQIRRERRTRKNCMYARYKRATKSKIVS